MTPETIFKNEVLAFDVNFFNPKADVETKVVIKEAATFSEYDYRLEYEGYVKKDGKILYQYPESENKGKYQISNGEFDMPTDYASSFTFANTTPESLSKLLLPSIGMEKTREPDSQYAETTYFEGKQITEFVIENTYKKEEGGYTGHYITKQTHHLKYGEYTIVIDYYIKYLHGWISKTETVDGVPQPTVRSQKEISPARILQPIVSAWYVTLRNIALVALMSVLVYIGIRITLSSVASDKAKYKQMLIDWVVAVCLVFLMHYIMSFAVTLNEKIIEAISAITTSNLYTSEDVSGKPDYETGDTNEVLVDAQKSKDKQQAGVQLFKIDNKNAVKNAYKTLVDDKGKDSSFYNRFTNENNDGSILFWPANDFMTQARILGQGATVTEGQDPPELDSKNVSVARAGYNIIYVVLVIYTVMFSFTYLKRLIYLAFLTIIAPLVAITYPIDKLNDGKAQAFNMWLREYIFNLLIQPMHLILYTVLIGSAMEFAAINIFYVVVALGFLTPAEKLLRRFFGFEKAQTPGAFGGVAGAALMMSGLSKLMHPRSSKGSLGAGGKDSKDGEEETKTPPWKDKEFDPTENLIGSGGQNSGDEQSEFRGNLNEDEQNRFDLARTGRDEALAGANDATTDEERQEYNNLADSYNRDLNEFRNPNWSPAANAAQARQGIQLRNDAKRANNKKRKRSVIRGIKRGSKDYLTGMGNKMKAKYKANGGIVRRGARMAAGLTAATLGAAGAGMIGITTGDASKAAQYMATAGAGGYTLGKGLANSAADKLKVEGSLQEAKKGYYGDDYKKVQQEKFKKEYMKNEENLRRIEDKLKVERKEAKKIMEENIEYYLDHEVSDIDDAIATYKLEKEGRMSREQAVATAQYATQVMNGEDTRTMTAKKKKEYRDTFIPKFQQQGSRNASGDVDTLFKNIDKFHGYKK